MNFIFRGQLQKQPANSARGNLYNDKNGSPKWRFRLPRRRGEFREWWNPQRRFESEQLSRRKKEKNKTIQNNPAQLPLPSQCRKRVTLAPIGRDSCGRPNIALSHWCFCLPAHSDKEVTLNSGCYWFGGQVTRSRGSRLVHWCLCLSAPNELKENPELDVLK